MAFPGVFIDLPNVCVAPNPAEPSDVLCLPVKIRLGNYIWTCFRRQSSFQRLDEVLRARITDAPPCPPVDPSGDIEKRREALLGWLRVLATDERVCAAPAFHEFLREGANQPPPGLVEVDHRQAAAAVAAAATTAGPASSTSPGGRPPRHAGEDSSSRVGLKDFSLLKVVGKGSFGKVMQVRKKDTGRIYAMKVLHKVNIIRRNQVEHTRTERNVLERIQHPFIVGLNYAFQSAEKLYFVLDYCAGGELFYQLGKAGKFPEPRARFYAAQIVEALGHVHSLGVVYRDLKPENVLLDHLGNVRLTDFGLSKENIRETDSGAFTFCGTPEYLAPEILNRSGHGRAVDWWSLGALLYEMLTGLPPFYCRDHKALFDKIRRGRLEFPSYLTTDARSLLNGLLTRDPLHRLGCGPTDADEIKAHPFFKPIDFGALVQCKIEAPWAPDVVGSQDTSQFDAEFTSMPIVSPHRKASELKMTSSVARVKFEGFTYVAPAEYGSSTAAGVHVQAARAHAAAAAAAAGATGSPVVESPSASPVPTAAGGTVGAGAGAGAGASPAATPPVVAPMAGFPTAHVPHAVPAAAPPAAPMHAVPHHQPAAMSAVPAATTTPFYQPPPPGPPAAAAYPGSRFPQSTLSGAAAPFNPMRRGAEPMDM